MKIIEITSKKADEMSELVEEMLMAGGKLMSCIERLKEESYNERGSYGERGGRYNDDYNERRGGMRHGDREKIESIIEEIIEKKGRR